MTVLELKQFLRFYKDDATVSIRYMAEDTEEIIMELAKGLNIGDDDDLVISGESIEEESATGVL